ncbi:Translation machinery-associated protein 22 [Polyrhizophydium stewartii]|uniref:Translation machinery-associated protein 22 n=1 Tax=Polyrhizophydium stewartii TaxID=2732419 RepID=A0ABR4MWB3_9FUNG
MEEVAAAPTRVLDVLYCDNCGLPPEYCEFGTSVPECKAWLKVTKPELYDQLYADEAAAAAEKIAALEIADGEGAAGAASAEGEGSSSAAAPAPAAQKPQKPSKKQAASAPLSSMLATTLQPPKKVVLTTIERTKRKRVTVIAGLEKFDVDLKKAAKQFATKFACGASVTKNPQGQDEIVVQGEFADDIFELILQTWPSIGEDSVEFGETKTKK